MSWWLTVARQYENLMQWLEKHVSAEHLRTESDFIAWCLVCIRNVYDGSDARVQVAIEEVYKPKRLELGYEPTEPPEVPEPEPEEPEVYTSRAGHEYVRISDIVIIPIVDKNLREYILYYDAEEGKMIKTKDALERLGE